MDLLMLQVKTGFCVYHKISLNIILDISNKVMRNPKNAEDNLQRKKFIVPEKILYNK